MSREGQWGGDPDATSVRPVARRAYDEATLPPPPPAGASAAADGDTNPRPRQPAPHVVADDTEPGTVLRPRGPAGAAPARSWDEPHQDGTILQPRRRWVSQADVAPPVTDRPDLYREPEPLIDAVPVFGAAPSAPPASAVAAPTAQPPAAPAAGWDPDPTLRVQSDRARGAVPATAPIRSVTAARPSASRPSSAAEPPPRGSTAAVRRARRGRRGRRAIEEEKPATLLGTIGEVGIIIVAALLASFLLRTFVVQPFEVPSGSMENTLRVGDKIAAEKVTSVERGDIVVFRDVNHWLDSAEKPRPSGVRKALEIIGLAPSSAEEHLVKRVVGMPGDRVRCCDKQGRLSVNGTLLDESAYLYADASGMVKASNVDFEVVVPQGHIFVMGDHRDASADSRCHLKDTSLKGPGAGAFIPLDAVVGTVPAIFMPFDRVRRLDNPDAYRAVSPPQQAAPAAPLIVKAPDSC